MQVFPLALGPELVDAGAAQPDADAERIVADIEQDDVGQDGLQIRGIDVGPRRQPAGLRPSNANSASKRAMQDEVTSDSGMIELVVVPRQRQGSAAGALELDDLAFPLAVHGDPQCPCPWLRIK